VLNNIKLIVYNFDGVMTDNRVIISEDGIESVMVIRADGLGILCLRVLWLGTGLMLLILRVIINFQNEIQKE